MSSGTDQAYMNESVDANIGMRAALCAHVAGIGIGMLIILSLTAFACVMFSGSHWMI
ncbi:hypothetical protein [Caballeronia sp. 15711]|uniref:hypothetical protein n=1 Tax=Caballeronia sp. 15711 TaxID=3391029 RepID=UPI0039E32A7C